MDEFTQLTQQNQALIEENISLKARIVQLERDLAKARKNSSTSSKPPSSDIVKPPKPSPTSATSTKRSPGGQPGHPKHDRPAYPPEQLTAIWEYTLTQCPTCSSPLRPTGHEPNIVQQVEICEIPLQIEEHRSHGFWCDTCQRLHYAPFPVIVKHGGLFGARITALVAYMKGVCHASFSTIRKFFRDVIGIRVSRGYLRKEISKVSEALEPAFEELLTALPTQSAINIDETGHKENGQRFWTWCFKAEMYTLFRIDKSRGSQVLIEVLGEEFSGVIGCDYFSAYRKYMRLNERVDVQFCLAHLIRDVKYLTTLNDAQARDYGEDLRQALKTLFTVIHQRDTMDAPLFQESLANARDAIVNAATQEVPPTKEAQNMAARFRKHGRSYFQFITSPEIGPTNNLAEQAIRFVVIDRRITQGTRSSSGRQWCERIWTVIATCTQRGIDIFDFLYQSILTHWTNAPHPSLLHDSG